MHPWHYEAWTDCLRSPHRIGCIIVAVMVLGLGCAPPPPPPPGPPTPTGGQNINFLQCFRQFIGVPGQSNPPTVNGVILNDLGWTRSFRYVFGNGTNVADAIVQGIKDNNNLYLSFEVNNDPTWDNDDAIVLTFDVDGVATNHRRIHIFPVFTGTGAQASGAPREVKYWTNSSTWNTGGSPAIVNPAWLDVKVTSTSSGPSSQHWYVEVRIPITASAVAPNGINFPATGLFGFYFNIIRVNGGPGTASEKAWPPNTPLIFPFLEANTPAPNLWGNGTRDATLPCNGVSLAVADITTNNTPNHRINLTGPNIFSATPRNNTIDGTGAFVPANQVTATFKIANFGLPALGQWTLVPTGNNPTSPPVNIPAAMGMTSGSTTLSTAPWNLTPTQQAQYQANDHQCILVELDSQAPGTLFVNKSAWRNMDFVSATSPFEAQATVGTAGYRLVPGQRAHEFLLSEYAYNTEPNAKWISTIRGVDKKDERLYVLRIDPEVNANLVTSVQPPDIRIPSASVEVLPGTGGQARPPVGIRVQPGNLITLIAEGTIRLRREDQQVPVGPGGMDLTERFAGQKFLLGKQYNPYTLAGALIGSWDGFRESSFLVGPAVTLKVPPRAEALFLAINDFPDGYPQQSGAGFRVQAVQTPLEKHLMFTDSIVSRDPSAEHLPIGLGANLPTWMLCGQRKTGQSLTINQAKYELVEDVGCYGYVVRRIGRQ